MILRFGICIPVYDNASTVARVARECLEMTPYPVIVIDDGSQSPVADILSGEDFRKAIDSDRLSIVRFPRNQGKGVALQRGFQECLRRGLTHMVSLDGDGQHFPSEIPKLTRLAEEDPWALIVGNRKLSGSLAPTVSHFGRSFSNFWVKYQTGLTVADSQSGFRVYPLFHVQCLGFWTRRFDFEVEVLIRLLWKGVPVKEAVIEVFYPPKEERVSHFHKFWDNLRISLLNTVLVALELLKSHRTPFDTALALGLGVVIGCTPFFGLHTLLAIAVAFLLRLNVAALWIGTQVSLPPLIPLLTFASLKIGFHLRGLPIPSPKDFSLGLAARSSATWLLGSLVLGVGLGSLVGVLAFVCGKTLQKRHAGKSTWTGNARGGRFGNWFLKSVTRHIGLGAGYFCLLFIVPYFYVFAPNARRGSLQFWKIVSPGDGWWRRRWRVLCHLRQFGILLLNRVYQSYFGETCFDFHSTGFENIRRRLEAREGLIVVGAHLGAWDMAAAYMHKHEVSETLHMLQYEAPGTTINKLKERTEPPRAETLFVNELNQPILSIHALLNEGRPVALMGDRPLGRHFELVPFFGKLAPFDTTPFKIAAACHKPLLFSYGLRGGKKRYEFFATPASYYEYEPGKDRAEQCRDWVEGFAGLLEEAVRKSPEQWLNFYPFWSSPPAAPGNHPKA